MDVIAGKWGKGTRIFFLAFLRKKQEKVRWRYWLCLIEINRKQNKRER